jgi:hypothetical protein
VRFNPPPTWPTPPQGWTPPPGWQPGPELPPVPMGWQLWVEDVPSAPAPEAGTGTPGLIGGSSWPAAPSAPASNPVTTPPLGHPGGSTVPGAFPAPGADASWAQPSAVVEQALHARSGATRTFWIGVGVFVAGAVSLTIASGDGGGYIWTGGLLFGVVLLVRALIAYRGARSAGAPAYSGRGRVALIAGLVACVSAAGTAGIAYAVPGSITPHATTGVGSCWAESDDSDLLDAVDCGAEHQYAGTAIVDVVDDCALDSVGYVEAEEGGYLCLRADS